MYEIDNEKFGTFLSQLRKERGMTQKDLAEHLYLSDKAVSKWERGLSLPDISLLQPLADLFGVTITELLSGQRIQPDQPLTVESVDPLLAMALEMTAQEKAVQTAHRRRWGWIFAVCLAAFAAEVFFLRETASEAVMLWFPPLFAAGFGAYFLFFCKEKLPRFYDQNRICFYSDGILRMNVPGVCFNNRNWPHILNAVRTWSCATLAVWTPLFAVLWRGLERLALPEPAVGAITLFAGLAATLGGLFLPIYRVGRKYE